MPVKKSAPSAKAPAAAAGRRIQVRASGVHGKGVFARCDLAKGELVIEYKGEIISWAQALERHPHDWTQPNHTFYFNVDENCVIDGGVRGNAARWINHACTPNCESEITDNDRVFIRTKRAIEAGEELSYDYRLVIDERYTKKLKAEYPCWCGTANCRGTLLAPKR